MNRIRSILLALMACGIVLGVCARWWLDAVPAFTVLFGVLVLRLLFERLQLSRTARALLLAIYAVHAACGIGLFWISAHHLPFGSSYQLGLGFWEFAPDAIGYHRYGSLMLHAWRDGTPFNIPLTSPAFQVYCGLVYLAIGPSPLGLILLNSLYAALTSLILLRLAPMVGGSPRLALWAAAVVGLWPTSLLWSSSIMKDSLGALLEISAVFLVLRLYAAIRPSSSDGAAPSRAMELTLLALLAAVVFELTQIRDYMGQAIVGTSLGLFIGQSLVLLLRRAPVRAGQALLAAAALVASFLLAGWVNPVALVSLPVQRRSYQVSVGQSGSLVTSSGAPTFPELDPNFWQGQEGLRRAVDAARASQRDTVDGRQYLAPVDRSAEFSPLSPSEVVQLCPQMSEYAVPNVEVEWRNGHCEVISDYRASLSNPPLSNLKDVKLRLYPKTIWRDLRRAREGFFTSGGQLIYASKINLTNMQTTLRSVPRALYLTMLLPAPSTWRASFSADWKSRLFAVEALLLWLLIPWVALGMWRWIRRLDGPRLYIVSLTAVLWVALGLSVVNFGTLVRLRLQLVVLWCLFAALGEGAWAGCWRAVKWCLGRSAQAVRSR